LCKTFGSNYRMTEIEAAIGLRQLQRLPSWQAQRAANAAILLDSFRNMPGLRTPEPPPHVRHAWYRIYTFVRPRRLKRGWNRDRILQAINAAGVACFTGICPEIYREQAFVDSGFHPPKRLPAAAMLGETSLAFLVDPCQDAVSLHRVCDVVSAVMGEATKERARTLDPPSAVIADNWVRRVRAKSNARNRTGFVGRQAGRID
jgi:dTDP-4-amino-4,6-dideoxygalactose transaminase